MTSKILLGFAIASLFVPRVRADDYGLKDGDTVVFLGDSITAARTYGKIIENYTLLRFPERKSRVARGMRRRRCCPRSRTPATISPRRSY